jgi:hypothetical protein
VTIVGRIGSYAILPSSPGSWYSSGEVVRALNGKGSQAIWDAGAASGGWSSFFGANSGSLARYVSQLVLISDYQLNVTVYGQFRAQDVTLLNSAALPAWPLFAQSPNYQLNSDATVSAVHQSSSANAIQIWGVSVQTV